MKKVFFILILSANLLTAQNWFPIAVGNKYQYLNYWWYGGAANYQLGEIHVTDSTHAISHTYFKFTDNNINGWSIIRGSWIRYDSVDNILYRFYNDSDRVYMDFSKSAGETFVQYCYPICSQGTRTVRVISRTATVLGITRYQKGYCYDQYATCDHFDVYTDSIGPSNNKILQAVIYSPYDTIIFDHSYYPEFYDFNPVDTVFSTMLKFNFRVYHHYNIFPQGMGEPVNYIDKVSLSGYYSNNDSIIQFNPVFATGKYRTDEWKFNFSLDISLLKRGYSFFYYFEAKDKGIIPHYTYSPDTGYYKLVYLDTLTEISDYDINPSNFLLSQNYPNPFNPSTNIKYAISSPQYATLKVYDILGNEVATLVDEYKPAGSYEVEFNASSRIGNLASGIYFYQLKAGEFVETKKMILLR